MNTHKPFLSLRFFFVVGIFFSNMRFTDIQMPETYQWLREYIVSEGWLGMSYFFKVAGFMMGYLYFERLTQRQIRPGRFILEQASHVYPIHWLTMLLAVPFTIEVFQASKTDWALEFLANASLIHTLIPAQPYFMSFNIPAWTLSNEMLFYFAFPLIAWAIVKMPKLLAVLWIALMIGIIITLEVVYVEFNTEMFYLFFFNPWFNLAEFGMGIAAYLVYARVKDMPYFTKQGNITVLEASSLWLLFVFFSLHNLLPQIYRFSYYYWIPLTFLVFAFSFRSGKVSALLSLPRMVFLGEMSLSFYLLHLSVRNYATFFNRKTHLLEDVYVRIAAIFVVTFILAYFFHVYVEKPLNARISKWLKMDESH